MLRGVLCQVAGGRLGRIVCFRSASTAAGAGVVKSPFPDVKLPEVSLDEFIWRKYDRWPEKTALVCCETNKEYKFHEVHDASNRVAQALRGRLGQLNRGDVIAIMLPNTPEFCIAMLGAIKAGIVVTTVNPIYTSGEVARQLSDAGAKAIITLSSLYRVVDEARSSTTDPKMPIITIKHQESDVTPDGCINFSELCAYGGEVSLGTSSPSDLALLPYSSGTTGLPKGVRLTHANIVANLSQINCPSLILNKETTASFQDVASAVLPMYHIYGLVLVFFNMFGEGCRLLISPRFSPDSYTAMIRRHKPTMLYTAPPIVLFLSNFEALTSENMKSVRTLMCGAAPLSPSDIEKFYNKFAGCKIVQGYGMTETSPLTHSQRFEHQHGTAGGIGWTLPNTESCILSLDDVQSALGPGETGQLAIRGPQVMQGYHNNAQATADTVDAQGWLRTGDIAHYDDDGQFHITDRLKELIKVKGYQVAPAELEALLRTHPDVADAAVTGVPHPKHGQAPKAFVVLRGGVASELRAQQLQEFVGSQVASFKQLTGGIVFVETIPKSPAGKILRRELKDM